MKSTVVNPTSELYSQIQRASEHFNAMLYGGLLPPVMFTFQRGRQTLGYFAPARWRHVHGSEVGEIALNPAHFAGRPIVQLFQTIVHEQCHVWQHAFGHPSRMGYHNAEWAQKMIEVGLMPSSTGEPGGMVTGQKMSDYPIPNGSFSYACLDLVAKDFSLTWLDQEVDKGTIHARTLIQSSSSQLLPIKMLNTALCVFFPDFQERQQTFVSLQKRKVKYQCPTCFANAWGKYGLLLICGQCGVEYQEIKK